MRVRLSLFMMMILFAATCANGSDVASERVLSFLKSPPGTKPLSQDKSMLALIMKAYIAGLSDAGMPEKEIIYRVAGKYSLNAVIDGKVRKEAEEKIVAQAGAQRPVLDITPQSFDFGAINKSAGKVSTLFVVQNKGGEKLTIDTIVPSCSCTTVAVKKDGQASPYFNGKGSGQGWKLELKPKEKAEFEVVFDAAAKGIKGKSMREVSFATSDPLNPLVWITVKADVQEK